MPAVDAVRLLLGLDSARLLLEVVSATTGSSLLAVRDRLDFGAGGGGGSVLLLGRERVRVETEADAETFRSDRYLTVLSAVIGVNNSQLLKKLTVKIKNRIWLHFLVTILSFVG